MIDLVFGVDWLEFLASDPAGGHGVLGRALAEGLRRALQLTGHQCEGFIAAWSRAAPVALIRAQQGTLSPGLQGRDRLPRSPATTAKARREIARRIIRNDRFYPAVYIGAGAVGLCGEVIHPAAIDAIATAIEPWAAAAILPVARCLNDAYADRFRRAGELEMALTAPWGQHWQKAALNGPEPAMLTWPLELLVEKLLVRSEAGEVSPDIFDIAEAAALAGTAIEVSLQLAATRHRLHDLAAVIHDDGQFVITDATPETATSVTIDVGAYRHAERVSRIRLRPEPLAGTPVELSLDAPRRDNEFLCLSELPVPGSLKTADAVMREALGTGSDAIRAVLGAAVTWTPGSDTVTEISRDELRDAAAAWSRLPDTEIDAALNLLSLTPARLREDGIRYWEQDRRSSRLPVSPLVCPDNSRLIIIPRLIEAALQLYAGYMLDGRLPWPPSAVPRHVFDAFNSYRNRQNRDLERQVLRTLSDLGFPARGNIEPHQARRHGLSLTGEIDALAADPQRSRLWVCEVKDVSIAASPRTIAARVGRYTGKDGYIAQLTRSWREVRASAEAAASLIGAADPGRKWHVLPLMITRNVEPAAFAQNLNVSFVTAEDLAAVITADSLPGPGHAG